ncbi:MAG: DUF2231 domain-containing protein [Ornithinimicrobium sp.]|jgi:hypothetical protein|uniref:DUF2231 domain-containing protein n=1 Tax=Ornithinimicrobium sp. TaxID=1977084 RepID=UPI003D9B11BB
MLPDVPLHPLLVHAAVVLIPVAALAVVLWVVLPRFRAWLDWGLPVIGVASGLIAWFTVQFGRELAEGVTQTPILDEHFLWGARVQWLGPLLGLAAVLLWLVSSPRTRWSKRTGVLGAAWLRIGIMVLSVVLAAATVLAVILAGDSGATSVWG